MKNAPQNFLFLIGLVIIGIGLLTLIADQSRQITSIPTSEFFDKVEKGEIKSVKIDGQEVFGTYQDGTRFETVIAKDANIWDLLRKHNVSFDVAQQGDQFGVWYILVFFAVAAFLGIAWYLARQGKGSGGSAIFSMGKNKAKMFLPTQVRERFDDVAGAKDAKEELQDIVDFLKNPEKSEEAVKRFTWNIKICISGK